MNKGFFLIFIQGFIQSCNKPDLYCYCLTLLFLLYWFWSFLFHSDVLTKRRILTAFAVRNILIPVRFDPSHVYFHFSGSSAWSSRPSRSSTRLSSTAISKTSPPSAPSSKTAPLSTLSFTTPVSLHCSSSHWGLFLPPQENPIMLSLPYTYVSLSLPLTDHFGSNVEAPGEERMGLSIYGFCFMPLNCCLTSVTPHRLPFWTQTTLVNTETEPGWAAVDCKWWFLTTETLLGGWVRKPKHEISEQLNFNFAVTVQPRRQHQLVPLLFWVIAGCIKKKNAIQSFCGRQKHKQEGKQRKDRHFKNVLRGSGAESDLVGAQGEKLVPSSAEQKRWMWKR